ncbi:MAG: VOC family protein [Acidobacteriota bacterium]|nr:VOC family protein [Acidobacteriota bacterium]
MRNLEKSARFYLDVLGFTEDSIRSPGWCFLSRDAFHLMLGECPDEVAASETGNHSWFVHVMVEGVDQFFGEVCARGAEILSPPVDRAYGLREFILRTPDGHRLVVGEPIVAAVK